MVRRMMGSVWTMLMMIMMMLSLIMSSSVMFVLAVNNIDNARLILQTEAEISNSIIEAGFPPVGVYSARIYICINFPFGKCLHPKETDSVDCVLNLG